MLLRACAYTALLRLSNFFWSIHWMIRRWAFAIPLGAKKR